MDTTTYSSFWGKLKPRKSPFGFFVQITIGTHTFWVDKKDPYLTVLQPRKIKKKVFVTVQDAKRSFAIHGKTYPIVSIVTVQVTDSYTLSSGLHQFWSEQKVAP